jgi:hypothetical protein
VSEARFAGNVIVEGNLDTDNIGNHFIQIVEHFEFVFFHEVLVVGIQAGNKSTQGSNPVPFPNAEDASVNVRRTGFQRGKTVGNGATAVIVSMKLDPGFNVMTQFRDQQTIAAVWQLNIGQSNSIDTHGINGDTPQIRLFARNGLHREANFAPDCWMNSMTWPALMI